MKVTVFISFTIIFFNILLISNNVFSQDLKLRNPQINPFQVSEENDTYVRFYDHKISYAFDKTQISKFTKADSNRMKKPYFYINIGAGLANGGRIDFIFKFVKFLSAEISYGADIRNFISSSDEESRLTFGVNWHSEKSFPLIISLLTTYAKSSSDSRIEDPRYLISINAGYLNMRKPGLNLIARAGFYIEYYKYSYNNEIKYGGFYPNLELGIGWAF